MRFFVNYFIRFAFGYFVFFLASLGCLIYNYRGKFTGREGQVYYIKGTDFYSFVESYKSLCKKQLVLDNDSFLYREPYHGEYEKVAVINRIHDRHASCSYFISSINSRVDFVVDADSSLKVRLLECNHSYINDSKSAPNSALSYYINGYKATFKDNWRAKQSFEKEVLERICKYEKDHLQGAIRLYTSFF